MSSLVGMGGGGADGLFFFMCRDWTTECVALAAAGVMVDWDCDRVLWLIHGFVHVLCILIGATVDMLMRHNAYDSNVFPSSCIDFRGVPCWAQPNEVNFCILHSH